MPLSVEDLSSQITVKDWDDRLGSIKAWKFRAIPKQHPSPSCVFTIEISIDPNFLPGFDKIKSYIHVDEVDLMRPEFRNQSNPEQAYINSAKAQFATNLLHRMTTAVLKHRVQLAAKASGILLAKKEVKSATTPELQRLKYNLGKRGFIPTKENPHAPNAHLNYKDYPLLSWA